MGAFTITRCRAAWLLCACLLLLPGMASAASAPVLAPAPALFADLDGDGLPDLATIDRADPTIIHVRLSRSNSDQTIHTGTRLQRVIAADIDGDRRLELVASAADGGLRIQVWKLKREQFKRYRAARQGAHAPRSPNGDGAYADAGPADAMAEIGSALFAPALGARPYVLALDRPSRLHVPSSVLSRRGPPVAGPLAPRPPPAHAPR